MNAQASPDSLKSALEDVRHAQRLMIEYHRRVLPLIEQIAHRLAGGTFWWRDINMGDGIGNSSSDPFHRNEWSYSPLADVQFAFRCQQIPTSGSPSPQTKYWTLGIRLVTDSRYSTEFLSDTASMPVEDAQTVLIVSAYRNEKWEADYWPPYHTVGNSNGWLSIADFASHQNPVTHSSHGPDVMSYIGWLTPLETFHNESAIDSYITELRTHLIEQGYLAP